MSVSSVNSVGSEGSFVNGCSEDSSKKSSWLDRINLLLEEISRQISNTETEVFYPALGRSDSEIFDSFVLVNKSDYSEKEVLEGASADASSSRSVDSIRIIATSCLNSVATGQIATDQKKQLEDRLAALQSRKLEMSAKLKELKFQHAVALKRKLVVQKKVREAVGKDKNKEQAEHSVLIQQISTLADEMQKLKKTVS